MSSSGTYTPGGAAANWLAEEWPAFFDVQVYERSVLKEQIRQLPKPNYKLHIPLFNNLDSAVLSETATGASWANFQVNTESAVVFTARSRVTPLEVGLPTLKRMAFDPQDELRMSCEDSIASAIDSDLLANASTWTTNIVGDPTLPIDRGVILDAHRSLVTGAKKFFEPGEQMKACCIVAATQDDDLLSIDSIVQAQIRGDSINPNVVGWVARAYGIDFYESTNVSTSAGYALNVMLIPRAMGIGFNQEPTVLNQDYLTFKRIICWSDYAYGTIRDQYAVAIKSTAAA